MNVTQGIVFMIMRWSNFTWSDLRGQYHQQKLHQQEWAFLESNFSWIAQMKGVIQDSVHHAEGNVAIHTQRVLEALEILPQWDTLSEEQQSMLWLAALLHDVEKRSTTQTDDAGRVTAHGHARKGEFTARAILYRDIPTPFVIREQIAALVRHHGFPVWAMEKTDPVRSLCEVSLRVNTALLAMLAEADMRGRICQDLPQQLERIELFTLFCQEQSCWGEARHFPSAEARFNYFYKLHAEIDYQPWADYRSIAILMCGLAGVGKDNYIRQHYADWPVISLDDIRRQHKLKATDTAATGWVVQQAKEQAKTYLRAGISFVWNATNLTRQIRQQLISLFAEYQAYTRIVYLEVPYTIWRKQNQKRDYAVPEQALDRMLSRLEVPLVNEAHQVEYVIKE